MGKVIDTVVKIGSYGTINSDFSGERAAQDAYDAQMDARGDVRAYYKPWQQAGNKALDLLSSGKYMEKDPGYDFRMNEGMRALQNSYASRGGALSGAALKGLTRYGQGFASNELGNAFNRQKSIADYGYGSAQALAGNAEGMGNFRAAQAVQRSNNDNALIQQGISGAASLGAAYMGMPPGVGSMATQGMGSNMSDYSNFSGIGRTSLNDYSNYYPSGGGNSMSYYAGRR